MTELWDNPLFPIEERLEIAKGAIGYRDRIIANLRNQLEAARAVEAKSVSQDRCYAPSCGKWDGTDSCTCQGADSSAVVKGETK